MKSVYKETETRNLTQLLIFVISQRLFIDADQNKSESATEYAVVKRVFFFTS